MLIGLSSEVAVVNEAKLINGLFEAGLKISRRGSCPHETLARTLFQHNYTMHFYSY